MAGRRIDDHSNWIGKPGKDMVMPQGVHTKSYSSADGEGGLKSYEDTSESIKEQQMISKSKIKAHGNKAHYRQ